VSRHVARANWLTHDSPRHGPYLGSATTVVVGQQTQQSLDCEREVFSTTAITLEEQSRSWISLLGQYSSDLPRQVVCYDRLVEMFAFFSHWRIYSFSAAAAGEFQRLREQKVRIATSDLKIASIAIVENAILLTANARDFERVPGLKFENWLEA